MVPTVWWYMNTTIPTLEKRRPPPDGKESTLKKFLGTWNEFESVLAENSSGNQGSINIVNSIMPLFYLKITAVTRIAINLLFF